jgi:hypothetical protein
LERSKREVVEGMRARKNIALLTSVAVVLLSAMTASAASAKPDWKFNKVELKGPELVAGVASPSSLTLPGVIVTCEHLAFVMSISNVAEVGRAELAELWPFECHTTNPACILESIEAKKVPWPAHAIVPNFLVIEGIDISIKFGGSLCALAGVVEITGTAGGRFGNSALEFNKGTFEATGTILRVGGARVEWTGLFFTEAFEVHREQTLELL